MECICRLLLLAAGCLFIGSARAQTDLDALMMNGKQFCAGFQYSHNAWEHYWEGELKRTNENIGTMIGNIAIARPKTDGAD